MLAAVVQLGSQDDVAANLAAATERVAEAAALGARLVVLPENFAYMGDEAGKRRVAERVDGASRGAIACAIAAAARAAGAFVVAGGMPVASDDEARPYNASVLFGPGGETLAVYRKVHLFDVVVGDGITYRESQATSAGSEPVVAEVLGTKIGMTVCYDVRFPELYRRLVDLGARIVTVPAAFTLVTGKDHWHALLRARAIENQVFVLAAAQHGRHPGNRATYGKSLIVDPWGDVLAQAGEGPGVAVANLDFDYQDRVRASLPCLQHRRL